MASAKRMRKMVGARTAGAVAARRYARLTRQRARILLEFVPGLRSALRYWVPDVVADDFCDGLVKQLRIVIRNPTAPLH